MLKKHFIEFSYPGILFSDTDLVPVDSWDIRIAHELCKKNNLALGFYFVTRGRTETELDSKEIARSKPYFLNHDLYIRNGHSDGFFMDSDGNLHIGG